MSSPTRVEEYDGEELVTMTHEAALSGGDLAVGGDDGEDLDGGDADSTIAQTLAAQDREAEQYALDFLSKVIRLRGVRIDREQYLSQELRKLALSDAHIAQALASTPVQAGVALTDLDELARMSVDFETRKSAGMSFAAGLPGGFAMLASVPADITQYYAHAFRIMQKLAYLYGWQDLLGDLDNADDETVGRLAVFLGVMMGVGGASASLGRFAQQVARPALQKQIARQALTKTVWYTPMKKTLAMIGVKVTKDSFARTVTKAVPVAGGVISGGMTLVSLKSQALRLHEHLRELPPPGVDAADYAEALAEADEAAPAPSAALTTVQNVAEGTQRAAAAAAGRATGAARGLLRRGRERYAQATASRPDQNAARPGVEADPASSS